MASPRETLRAAVRDCLAQITVANGYATDAGLAVTLEPGQVGDETLAVLAPLVTRQERASEQSQARTHRLTTLAVLAKVPADLGEAQARLDDLIADVERAMADKQARYPIGYQFPQYVAMEPAEAKAGMGWVGALITYQSHIPIK
ncbi:MULTISPECIES: Clp protease/crotonase-like domain-containing protein [Xanthomonas]|uniref:Uncharacterized protein n=2 Tax=Xanthomonas citri TaxID=346 RepID=A0AB33CC44_XANCI|nr:hypothetical protein [Xanthomonas citri]MBV6780958.1 hypothetical protein [Xanthomonas campestris pv. trichodesmae]MBV6788482.1 hypothetical protein [Xanthomonas campestris pv. clerodendri]ASK91874.1 hypothetical protein XcvCFBP7111P_10460 [Xanthomonas citri pv. vignicola]MBZ3919203.1 hypothetical protein [Xanthomonas campestris pv. trichodesmae]MBZ3922916.1 hypothetical protein [Xanthomonas citri pv. sesbaniae]